MKRLLTLLMLVLVVGLVGCGKKTPTDPEDGVEENINPGTLQFRKVSEVAELTVASEDISSRLMITVSQDLIDKIGFGSDVQGWGSASELIVDSEEATVISGIRPDDNGNVRGTPFVITSDNQVIYFDLSKFGTDPSGGVVDDGNGGKIVQIPFSKIP